MPSEFEEIKNICIDFLKTIDITDFTITFAKRMDGYWKVVVRYSKSGNPEKMSSLMVNWTTKKVDTFIEDIPTF